MDRRLTMCLILAMGLNLSAQTIALSGKVTDQSGKPIFRAVVALVSQKLSDTTDATGAYSLSSTTAVDRAPVLPGCGNVF